MGIEVLRQGLLSVVQDLGRVGYQKFGVPVSGAMDTQALIIGNILLGNTDDTAGIEFNLIGASLKFHQDLTICLTGADFKPTLDGNPFSMYVPQRVRKGSVLQIGKKHSFQKLGCRSYLTVRGGFDVPEVMGSRSTSLLGQFGGYKGRALKEGDFLALASEDEPHLRNAQVHAYGKCGAASALRTSYQQKKLRVMLGPESNWFDNKEIDQLFQRTFTVMHDSNRMGLRVKGYSLERTNDQQLLSSAVCFGTVQVPADGNPVILAADHQTIGGYPRIAQVIKADLPILGQLAPGDAFEFECVSAFHAAQLWQKRERMLNRLRAALTLK